MATAICIGITDLKPASQCLTSTLIKMKRIEAALLLGLMFANF